MMPDDEFPDFNDFGFYGAVWQSEEFKERDVFAKENVFMPSFLNGIRIVFGALAQSGGDVGGKVSIYRDGVRRAPGVEVGYGVAGLGREVRVLPRDGPVVVAVEGLLLHGVAGVRDHEHDARHPVPLSEAVALARRVLRLERFVVGHARGAPEAEVLLVEARKVSFLV